ncbi:uncharacterized protein LOC127098216 [Lathyrus oleraceus]|uniref:uncharacterized protein LOC127098216 n=1 Tax=Pisum sativum TaxID=3888 RepID=UPI0021D10870|nr:uncharacterized protein LOC127098216 [Pisum sativum]
MKLFANARRGECYGSVQIRIKIKIECTTAVQNQRNCQMGDGTSVANSFCGRTNSGVVCVVKVCVPLYDTKTRAWKCAPCRVVHQLNPERAVVLQNLNSANCAKFYQSKSRFWKPSWRLLNLRRSTPTHHLPFYTKLWKRCLMRWRDYRWIINQIFLNVIVDSMVNVAEPLLKFKCIGLLKLKALFWNFMLAFYSIYLPLIL